MAKKKVNPAPANGDGLMMYGITQPPKRPGRQTESPATLAAAFEDEQIVEQLTQVKGIGCWTAQMFLIFSLGRPDVFPHDDLGVRTAIRDRYGLAKPTDKATSHAIAAPWRPWASVASWYCWRSLDLARNTKTTVKGYPS